MTIASLPPTVDLETKTVLKRTAVAHRHLAELKGSASSMPTGAILINTLGLQEARASSEIENIVTTEDELFKAQAGETATDPAAKEVARYAEALREGFERLHGGGVLSTSLILHLQEILEGNRAGFRKLPERSFATWPPARWFIRHPRIPRKSSGSCPTWSTSSTMTACVRWTH